MKNNIEMFKNACELAIKDYNLWQRKESLHNHRIQQIEKIKKENKIYRLLFKKHIFLS